MKGQIEGTYYKPLSLETKAWLLILSPPTNLSLNGRFNFLLLFERKGGKKTQSRQNKGARRSVALAGGDSCCIHG